MLNVWLTIMKSKSKIWKRNCPTCGTQKIYKTKQGLQFAIERNTVCPKCARTGKNNHFYGKYHSSSSKMKMSIAHTGKIRTVDDINKWKATVKVNKSFSGNKNPMFGMIGDKNPFYRRTHTDESKRKISKANKGKLKNIPKTSAHRKKIRLSYINYITRKHFNGGQMAPNYNISSIPILEAKAKELGITDLQHAENGGEYHIKELGYWVDGYSKEKNIVLEYDEPQHFNNGKLSKKDLQRQKEITDLLKCKFIRIKG